MKLNLSEQFFVNNNYSHFVKNCMTTCLRSCDMNAIGDSANPWSALAFSDNQQQHLFLGQRRIIGNMMWMWLSSFIRRIWNCAIRIIRILESLTTWGKLLRTVGQIWVFLRACFLRWWNNTWTCAHTRWRNTTKKTMTCNFWYCHS